jgi:hypothetical protein
MMKSRESKMLDKVRRWRKKAFEADKGAPSSKQAKADERIAQKLGLPRLEAPKAGSARQQ